MDLSLVIPAYNERYKISKDILAADKFLSESAYSAEIIIVDDGSTDNTYETVDSYKGKTKTELIVIKLPENIGKGGALREGINVSVGDIVIYADAGLTVPFENSLLGIDLIEKGKCDIANGSRKMEGSIIITKQDFDRRVISKIFGMITKLFLGIPEELTDTQCGFKVYNGDTARKLFKCVKTNGFLFEIEFILLALKEGCKIKEFPLTWNCDRDSRLSIRRSSLKIISEFVSLVRKQ